MKAHHRAFACAGFEEFSPLCPSPPSPSFRDGSRGCPGGAGSGWCKGGAGVLDLGGPRAPGGMDQGWAVSGLPGGWHGMVEGGLGEGELSKEA